MMNRAQLDQIVFLGTESTPKASVDFQGTLTSIQHTFGASAARYYNLSRSVAGEGFILSLVASSANEKTRVASSGFRMQWKETSAFQSGSGGDPWECTDGGGAFCARDHASAADPDRGHIEALGLIGYTWYEIVITTNHSAGLLALDWLDEADQIRLDGHQLSTAALCARWLLGLVLNPPPDEMASRFTVSNHPSHLMALDVEDLRQRLDDLRRMSRAAAIAAFSYDWRTGRLSKIMEAFAENITPSKQGFESHEAYYPGHYHTGKALENPELRHVPDFGWLRKSGARHADVSSRSLERHRALLGEVDSLLYCLCGGRTDGILLRMINRVDQQGADFGPVKSKVELFGGNLSAEFARLGINRLVDDITGLSDALSGRGMDMGNFRDACVNALRGRQLYGVHYLIENQDHDFELWSLDTTGAKLPLRVLRADDVGDLQRAPYSFERHLAPDLAASLPDTPAWFILQVEDPLHCIVLVPAELSALDLDTGEIVDRPQSDLREVCSNPPPDVQFLLVLTRMLSLRHNAIRFYQEGSTFGTAFALYMHHELVGRATSMAATALLALDDATREMDRSSPARKSVVAERAKVKALNDELVRLLRPAGLLNSGRMSVTLVPLVVHDLLRDAAVRAQERFSEEFSENHGIHAFEIWREGLQGAVPGRIIGDRELLLQALVSMLDNAIKYSNPRDPSHESLDPRIARATRPTTTGSELLAEGGRQNQRRRTPCIVTVREIWLGGTLVVEVSNWGVPAPKDVDQLWTIFERGGVRDPRRKVPGLGLGLYLTRLAASVHGGTARLESRPTLSDPRRRDREGFLTNCRLTMSLRLLPGDYSWDADEELLEDLEEDR